MREAVQVDVVGHEVDLIRVRVRVRVRARVGVRVRVRVGLQLRGAWGAHL